MPQRLGCWKLRTTLSGWGPLMQGGQAHTMMWLKQVISDLPIACPVHSFGQLSLPHSQACVCEVNTFMRPTDQQLGAVRSPTGLCESIQMSSEREEVPYHIPLKTPLLPLIFPHKVNITFATNAKCTKQTSWPPREKCTGSKLKCLRQSIWATISLTDVSLSTGKKNEKTRKRMIARLAYSDFKCPTMEAADFCCLILSKTKECTQNDNQWANT